jgi:transposase
VALRIAEQQRVAAATTAPVRPPIQAHLVGLEQALKEVGDERHRTIEPSPIGRTRDELVRRVPGSGPVVGLGGWRTCPSGAI